MTAFNVANASQLQASLRNAAAGDVIFLAPGKYGSVVLSGLSFNAPVTIISADQSNPAEFDYLQIRESKGLSVRSVDIGRALTADEPLYLKMVSLYNAEDIIFDKVHIHGSLDGNAQNDAWGMSVSGGKNITVRNSEFQQVRNAIAVEKSVNTSLVDNNFHDIGNDGIEVAGSSYTLIDGNRFDRFFPSPGDHPDAIQLFNTYMPTGSDHIVIQNNVMLQTGGQGPQGIFISDAGQFGYNDILIANNLMYGNDLYNGIAISGATDVQILNNTVLSSRTDNKSFWIRLNESKDIVVDYNVMDNLILTNVTNLAQNGNINLARQSQSFTDLNTPSSILDLSVDGVGYSEPEKPMGSVSKSLAVLLHTGTNIGQGLSFTEAFTLPQDADYVPAYPEPAWASIADGFAPSQHDTMRTAIYDSFVAMC